MGSPHSLLYNNPLYNYPLLIYPFIIAPCLFTLQDHIDPVNQPLYSTLMPPLYYCILSKKMYMSSLMKKPNFWAPSVWIVQASRGVHVLSWSLVPILLWYGPHLGASVFTPRPFVLWPLSWSPDTMNLSLGYSQPLTKEARGLSVFNS